MFYYFDDSSKQDWKQFERDNHGIKDASKAWSRVNRE